MTFLSAALSDVYNFSVFFLFSTDMTVYFFNPLMFLPSMVGCAVDAPVMIISTSVESSVESHPSITPEQRRY